MLNQNEKDTLKRYLAGKASDSETYQVESLFAKGISNPELKKLLLEDWSAFQTGEDTGLSHVLDRIHHILRVREMERQKSFKNRFIQIYFRVAAMLLIPLLLAGLWYYFTPEPVIEPLVDHPVTTTIYAPLGSRVAFSLPDGSTGFLNSGSTLTYTIPFASNRMVDLKGEAWFDVVHDEQHPFEIGAGTSAVRVLGTSFNVSAYENENYIEIVLAAGSIEFMPNQFTPAVLLKPSERLVFNGEKINIEITEPEKFYGWTEGKLIFRGDNMGEVARRLERWYNIEVVVADAALNDYIFRATFVDDSLQEVLRLLSMTSPIRYRITPRHSLPDGTWKKEKVTLYKRN
jgi:ferric-dicitrate binding protein FerR (iron transport regulator)